MLQYHVNHLNYLMPGIQEYILKCPCSFPINPLIKHTQDKKNHYDFEKNLLGSPRLLLFDKNKYSDNINIVNIIFLIILSYLKMLFQ